MNKLSAMQAFCLVAEHQNFTVAAREMGISNTLVSRNIKQLEQQLGCLLLKRNTRKVFLTPAGEQYRDHIKPILKKLSIIDKQMNQLSDQPSGKLTISTTLELGSQYFAPLIAIYRKAYPKVELDFTLGNTPEDLFESKVDLAFRVAPNLPNSSHIAQTIGSSKLAMWASPSYIKSHGAPESLEQLHQHQLMFFSHSIRNEQWLFEHQGQRTSLKLPWAWVSDNGRLLNEAAALGQGIIQAPSYSVASYVKANQLIEILPQFTIQNLSISAVYPHRYQLSNRIGSFVETAKQYFIKHPLP